MSDVSRKKPAGQRTSGNRSWQGTRIFRGVQYVGARERRYVVVEVRRRWLGAARKGVGDLPVGSPWPVHCRTSGSPVTVPHRQAGRLQVAAGGLTPDPGGLLDPPQRPAEASQREDLLSFLFCQDVAHAGQERPVPDRRQRLGPLSEIAGFQGSISQ